MAVRLPVLIAALVALPVMASGVPLTEGYGTEGYRQGLQGEAPAIVHELRDGRVVRLAADGPDSGWVQIVDFTETTGAEEARLPFAPVDVLAEAWGEITVAGQGADGPGVWDVTTDASVTHRYDLHGAAALAGAALGADGLVRAWGATDAGAWVAAFNGTGHEQWRAHPSSVADVHAGAATAGGRVFLAGVTADGAPRAASVDPRGIVTWESPARDVTLDALRDVTWGTGAAADATLDDAGRFLVLYPHVVDGATSGFFVLRVDPETGAAEEVVRRQDAAREVPYALDAATDGGFVVAGAREDPRDQEALGDAFNAATAAWAWAFTASGDLDAEAGYASAEDAWFDAVSETDGRLFLSAHVTRLAPDTGGLVWMSHYDRMEDAEYVVSTL